MMLLIYNPVSGISGDDFDEIISSLHSKDINFDTLVTKGDSCIDEYFCSTLTVYDCIIAAGGDGTISQVIQSIVNRDLKSKLLIYPRGTTNEYATSLNVDKGTLNRFLNNNYFEKCIDIGKFSDKGVFTYSFVFGNFSHVPYETPQWLKNRLGYIAYWLYGFVTLYIFRLKRYEMSFKFNNKVVDGKFLFGSVSNSESLGKVIQLSDVSYSDGYMEIFLVKSPSSFKEVILFLHDARTGRDKSGLFLQDKVSEVEVNSPNVHAWSADGEFSGSFDSLSIKVKEKAVYLIC